MYIKMKAYFLILLKLRRIYYEDGITQEDIDFFMTRQQSLNPYQCKLVGFIFAAGKHIVSPVRSRKLQAHIYERFLFHLPINGLAWGWTSTAHYQASYGRPWWAHIFHNCGNFQVVLYCLNLRQRCENLLKILHLKQFKKKKVCTKNPKVFKLFC